MIFRLFRGGPGARTIDALYGAIVAQARHPAFYLGFEVPDTAEGRFDMIVLRLALLCRRLGRERGSGQALGQGVFDTFGRDMDHNLREMGVGDLTVPKKMQKLAEAFYGRREVYERALAGAGDEELAAALARNVLAPGAADGTARRFVSYVRAAAERLDAAPFADLSDGALELSRSRCDSGTDP